MYVLYSIKSAHCTPATSKNELCIDTFKFIEFHIQYIYPHKMSEKLFIVHVYVIRVGTENIISVFENLFTEHLYFFVAYALSVTRVKENCSNKSTLCKQKQSKKQIIRFSEFSGFWFTFKCYLLKTSWREVVINISFELNHQGLELVQCGPYFWFWSCWLLW